MKTILRFLAIAAGALGLMATGAAAVPAAKFAPGVNSPAVELVHGFHRRCAWGPARFHRHIPGVGNVRCATGPSYRTYYYGRPRAFYRPRAYIRPRAVIRHRAGPSRRSAYRSYRRNR